MDLLHCRLLSVLHPVTFFFMLSLCSLYATFMLPLCSLYALSRNPTHPHPFIVRQFLPPFLPHCLHPSSCPSFPLSLVISIPHLIYPSFPKLTPPFLSHISSSIPRNSHYVSCLPTRLTISTLRSDGKCSSEKEW